MVFDYTGGATPASTIESLLTTSYGTGWTGGQFLCSTADAAHGLGWLDDAGAQAVTVQYAFYGDADLDNSVNLADLTLLGQNWRGTGKSWGEGDFNYDGTVDLLDLTMLGQNWRATALGMSFSEAMSMVGLTVPEPGTFVLLFAAVLGLAADMFRRRWR